MVTGISAAAFLRPVVERLNEVRGLRGALAVVRNRLFGPTVTVSGLLAGRDILDTLLPRRRSDLYLLPANCLRPWDRIFLDDLSLDHLAKHLDRPVVPIDGTRVVVVQMTDGGEGYPEPEMKDTIVEMRRREAEAANHVLGVAQRYLLGRPDMALINDKATLQEVMAIIRKEKPEAAFVQGDRTLHRDHLATSVISIEALWHAGGPVCALLGASWKTPEVYIYKDGPPSVKSFPVDVKGFGHKFYDALATQESQYTLFAKYMGLKSPGDVPRDLERRKREEPRHVDTCWILREVLDYEVLPPVSAHRLKQWSPAGAK